MNNEFSRPEEEVLRIADEIRQLKEALQGVNLSIAKIEKRLRNAFPSYPANKRPSKKVDLASTPAQSKSREELLQIFERVLEATKEKGDIGFSRIIETIPDNDLQGLAYELGVSTSKRISNIKAKDGIKGRIHETILLTSGIKDNKTQEEPKEQE